MSAIGVYRFSVDIHYGRIQISKIDQKVYRCLSGLGGEISILYVVSYSIDNTYLHPGQIYVSDLILCVFHTAFDDRRDSDSFELLYHLDKPMIFR